MLRLVNYLVCLALVIFTLAACSKLEDDISSPIPHEAESIDFVSNVEQPFYYYFDEKVSLSENRNFIAVQFNDKSEKQKYLDKINNGVTSISLYVGDPFSDDNLVVIQKIGGCFSDEDLALLLSNKTVDFASFSYEYDGNMVFVKNELSFQLKEGVSIQSVKQAMDQVGCRLFKRDTFGEDIFFVNVPSESDMMVIDLAREMYETNQFVFVAPDFLSFHSLSSSDPLYYSQWALNYSGYYGTSGPDINIERAWNITVGDSGIIVAVVDDGVELNHPDLVGNLISGYDAIGGSTSGGVANAYDVHGTPVAGIIGAVKDNGIGISGVAPGCKIMPIRAIRNNHEDQDFAAEGITWAYNHGADVINCSWASYPPNSLLSSAILNATTYGRDGKGCVVVFSSGNTRNGDHGAVSYPAYLATVLSVGAISSDGRRIVRSTHNSLGRCEWSSNYGSSLDVVAPGINIMSTSRRGSYDVFEGTSAAAPIVSGIAALVLSEYPELPQELVRQSIERGCVNLSSYYYHDDGRYPVDYRNDEVGYGLVDAYYSLAEAGHAMMQHITDITPGLDFVLINSSSYSLDDVIIDVQGSVSGQPESLITADLLESVDSQKQAGYPVYRGENITASPGAPITGITVDVFASSVDCPGEIEIGVAFDTPTPNSFDRFEFGFGETYHKDLPDIVVPNGERRTIYIRIFDV